MEHNYANKSLTYLFLFFFLIFGRNLILSLAEPPSSCLSSMASGLILITVTVVLPVLTHSVDPGNNRERKPSITFIFFRHINPELAEPMRVMPIYTQMRTPTHNGKMESLFYTHSPMCTLRSAGCCFRNQAERRRKKKHIDALKGINTFSACKQRSAS